MGTGLLSKRKISAYLVYALGEIVLIVTGILVAISLNNWNESRKQQERFYTTIGRLYRRGGGPGGGAPAYAAVPATD